MALVCIKGFGGSMVSGGVPELGMVVPGVVLGLVE
jgi:hypothetical protein